MHDNIFVHLSYVAVLSDATQFWSDNMAGEKCFNC